MTRITLTSKVAPDGTLTLTLPADAAGQEVRVTIESATPQTPQARDEWEAAILATAGAWQGDFERPPQGQVEERDPL
jgi:hypothetical protein